MTDPVCILPGEILVELKSAVVNHPVGALAQNAQLLVHGEVIQTAAQKFQKPLPAWKRLQVRHALNNQRNHVLISGVVEVMVEDMEIVQFVVGDRKLRAIYILQHS